MSMKYFYKQTRKKFGKLLRRSNLYNRIWRLRHRKEYTISSMEEKCSLELFSMFLNQDSLCIDIGANIGAKTKIFLATGAKVVAIEPQAECVEILERKYGDNKNFQVLRAAIGEQEGSANMHICSATSTLSTLSQEWMEVTKKHGRFAQYEWDKTEIVPVITLDKLIESYGVPEFIKIDVEGFEQQVIKGMTRPPRALSLEFAHEVLDSTFTCLGLLAELGQIELNYALGKEQKLVFPEWVGMEVLEGELRGLRKELSTWGDVYVRYSES